VSTRPPVVVALDWLGDLRFQARSGDVGTALDGDGRAAVSPVQALVIALAGCMASDVVHILSRARLPPRSLDTRITAERAPEDPRRLVTVALRFSVAGDIPPDRIQHAIDLSRQTYCSVWHSLRPDLEFVTSFEVAPAS
jgi:putative redox protein